MYTNNITSINTTSHVDGKPEVCPCEKLGTDQQCYTCAADQFHSLAKIYTTYSSNVKSDQNFSMHTDIDGLIVGVAMHTDIDGLIVGVATLQEMCYVFWLS